MVLRESQMMLALLALFGATALVALVFVLRWGEKAAKNCLAPGWQSRFPVAGLRVQSMHSPQPRWLETVRSTPASERERAS